MQGQEQYNRIQVSRYNERYKYIRTRVRAEYLEKGGGGASQKVIATARCGNMEEWNRYWLDEESRRCVLCKQGRGTLKHLIEDYVELLRAMRTQTGRDSSGQRKGGCCEAEVF